ncbi:hypothetical protein SEVIR_2G180250v4 [Setaria viridis]
MRELGVAAAVAVPKKRSPPLVVANHHTRLPFKTNSVYFVFAGLTLETAKRPANLAAEAARRGSGGAPRSGRRRPKKGEVIPL